jgi:hypothetical protein
MDSKLFAQLAMTFAIAILGGWLGHYFSARRDLTNERRKLRITYLLEAYRKFESASQRTRDHEQHWSALESATADIQLLGSPHQVRLARRGRDEMGQDSTASTVELLTDLRESLRAELKLEPVSEGILFIRFTGKAD